MNKKIKFTVSQNGIPFTDYSWNESTKTFSALADFLVIDFGGNKGITFKTGHSCTFTTGSDCNFNTDHNCNFNTRYGCTFETGYSCTFTTGHNCIFNTLYNKLYSFNKRFNFKKI